MNLPCSCGKQLRVSESHVGRTVRCPGCGQAHVVTADKPPGSAPAVRPALPSSLPTLLRLAAVLLLVFGVGVGGWWVLRPGAGVSDEEGLLPADAELIALGRPAALYAVPEFREGFMPEMNASVVRVVGATGLAMERVERMALVAYRPAEERAWVVLWTLDAVTEAGLTANLAGGRTAVFARQRYHVGTAPDGWEGAVARLGERAVLLGDEESVKTALGLRGRRGEASKLSLEGHHVAIRLNPGPWRDGVTPGVPVASLRGAVLTLDVAARTTLTATAKLPAGEGREEAVAALKKGQALAAAAALGGDPLLEMLGSGELDEDGDALRLRAEGDTAAVMKALANWARRAGR